jgi:antitoxin ParD1/3/4
LWPALRVLPALRCSGVFAEVDGEAGPSELMSRNPRSRCRRSIGRRRAGNVSLTPELEALIQEHVRSGRYTSASEVVREALRLPEDRDELRRLRLAELRSKVAAGLDSLDRGQPRDGVSVIDEILDGLPASSQG